MVRSRRHPGKLSNQVGQSRTAFQELVHHLHHHHHHRHHHLHHHQHHLRKPTMVGISHCGNMPPGHPDHYHSYLCFISICEHQQKTKRTKGQTNTKITSSQQKLIEIQHQNLNQTSASKSRPNFSLDYLTKIQLQILDRLQPSLDLRILISQSHISQVST